MKTIRFTVVFLLILLSASQTILAGRYYDSETSRFLTVDPKAHKFPGGSPYVYCMNNPLTNVDPDGKEPITITTTGVVAAGAITIALIGHTYNYLTNPTYRKTYDSFTGSVADVTSKTTASIWERVTSLFSSGESTEPSEEEQAPSIEEQAEKLSEQAGKNSVTLPDGTRVDLKGRGHTDKTTGEKVKTPHTHEVENHTNPKTGESFVKTKKVPRPTTQEDIEKVKSILNK